MKKLLGAFSIVLILTLIFAPSAFAESGYAYSKETLAAFSPKWTVIQSDETVISLTPGGECGEIRFAWLSENTDSSFRISGSSDMHDSEFLRLP